jgi:hypothetical protein
MDWSRKLTSSVRQLNRALARYEGRSTGVVDLEPLLPAVPWAILEDASHEGASESSMEF